MSISTRLCSTLGAAAIVRTNGRLRTGSSGSALTRLLEDCENRQSRMTITIKKAPLIRITQPRTVSFPFCYCSYRERKKMTPCQIYGFLFSVVCSAASSHTQAKRKLIGGYHCNKTNRLLQLILVLHAARYASRRPRWVRAASTFPRIHEAHRHPGTWENILNAGSVFSAIRIHRIFMYIDYQKVSAMLRIWAFSRCENLLCFRGRTQSEGNTHV